MEETAVKETDNLPETSKHRSNFSYYDYYFVVDLETSGSCPVKNGVIEFQLLVTDKRLNVINSFYRKVRPDCLSVNTWDMEAQEIHKFTLQECFSHMPNDQFCFELLTFLRPYLGFKNAFVCHASPSKWNKFVDGQFVNTNWGWFDWHFLEWCMRKARFSDGQEMVWSFFKIFSHEHLISTVQMGRDAGYKGNKLPQWAERLNFKLEHHTALSDTLCCLEVFKYLFKGSF